MKKSPCRDAGRKYSKRSTHSPLGEVAASFSSFSDNRKIAAGLMAELPRGLRMPVEVWICNSGSSSPCSTSFLGMTNYWRATGRRLVVACGQSIPIVDIGDVRIAFTFLAKFGTVRSSTLRCLLYPCPSDKKIRFRYRQRGRSCT